MTKAGIIGFGIVVGMLGTSALGLELGSGLVGAASAAGIGLADQNRVQNRGATSHWSVARAR